MIKDLRLESERLVLKILDESGADRVLEYYLRNRDFLAKWEPVRDEDFYSLSFHQQLLRDEVQAMLDGRMWKVWIFEKSDTGLHSVIGSIALNNIVRGSFQSCHLGYKLDGNKINKGYMTEGLEMVIKYAFEQLMLHRIEANIMPHNLASRRVVEKLHFYNEGLARKYLKINGRWEDHIHMVLLNEAME